MSANSSSVWKRPIPQLDGGIDEDKICHECYKSYSNTYALKRHVVTVHGNEGASLEPEQILRHSIWDAPSGEIPPKKPYVCSICGKGCKRLDTLQAHLRNAHKVSRSDPEYPTAKKLKELDLDPTAFLECYLEEETSSPSPYSPASPSSSLSHLSESSLDSPAFPGSPAVQVEQEKVDQPNLQPTVRLTRLDLHKLGLATPRETHNLKWFDEDFHEEATLDELLKLPTFFDNPGNVNIRDVRSMFKTNDEFRRTFMIWCKSQGTESEARLFRLFKSLLLRKKVPKVLNEKLKEGWRKYTDGKDIQVNPENIKKAVECSPEFKIAWGHLVKFKGPEPSETLRSMLMS